MALNGAVSLSVLGSTCVARIDRGSEGHPQARYSGSSPSSSGRRSPVKFQELRCSGEEYSRACFSVLPSRSGSRRSCLDLQLKAGQIYGSKPSFHPLLSSGQVSERSGLRKSAGAFVVKDGGISGSRNGAGENTTPRIPHSEDRKSNSIRSVIVKATIQDQDQEQTKKDPKPDAEETTRKLGLEAGLWQIFSTKDESKEGSKESKTSQAKALLTRYGGAYLVTSISLSVVSFGLCYVLVNNGVDVAALLQKVGIQSNETGEKVGTFALAYAAHKAASPIRFPPTVALTPIVAGWFGKKPADVAEEDTNS